MRRNLFFILIVLSIVILTGVSCKSTPKTTEEPAARPAQTAASPASVSLATEARKRAMDFECPAYFPSEWESAEAQFTAANDTNAYNAVAAVYDELFKKTVPLYAQAREDEIIAAREQLVSSGFTEYFPQYLKNADDLALAAMEKYEAEDYYGARDAATAAMNEFETLLAGAKIFLTRQEIIDRGFTQYDADNFLKADEVAQAAIEAYDAGNKEAALASGEEALLRYNIVLSNGWTAYAADRKASASSERQLALADRANIASRETFREGDSHFNQAEELFAAETFSEAALLFVEAEAIFAISRKETEEKRVRAEEAIRIAEEKIEESSGAANEAERIIEGGSR